MENRSEIWKKMDRLQIKHQLDESYYKLGDWFENAVKSQLKMLKDSEINLDKKIVEINDKLSGDEKEDGSPCDSDIEIYSQMGSLNNELYEVSEQRYAIWQMIFVNIFRTMEIGIKTQLSTIYPAIDLRDLYIWENIKGFLKSKKIEIGSFKEYAVINQIRLINNDIKHSSKISENVLKQQIPEFSGKEYYDSESLNNYYDRIKDFPKLFMKQLSNELFDEMYKFDDERIGEIAKDFKKRMDKNAIAKFIEKLKT